METAVTCGELHKQCRELFRDLKSYDDIFAAGVICGQSEKVYLGACSAAMFRPSRGRFHFCYDTVLRASNIYGLSVESLRCHYAGEACVEIWICRGVAVAEKVRQLDGMKMNSEAWHAARASLCGIPSSEWDFEYHLRGEFGKRCD